MASRQSKTRNSTQTPAKQNSSDASQTKANLNIKEKPADRSSQNQTIITEGGSSED